MFTVVCSPVLSFFYVRNRIDCTNRNEYFGGICFGNVDRNYKGSQENTSRINLNLIWRVFIWKNNVEPQLEGQTIGFGNIPIFQKIVGKDIKIDFTHGR